MSHILNRNIHFLLTAFPAGWAVVFLAGAGLVPDYPVFHVVLGLVFLAIGLYTWLQSPGEATSVLLIFCTGCCLAFSPSPWFGSDLANIGFGLIRSALIFTAMAAVLHFALLVPWGAKRPPSPARPLVYLPFGVAWLIVAVRGIWLSDSGDLFNSVMLVFVGILSAIPVMLAAIIFLRKLVRSGAELRRSTGLRTLFASVVIGVVPALAMAFTAVGQQRWGSWLILSSVLVPASASVVARNIVQSGSPENSDGRA